MSEFFRKYIKREHYPVHPYSSIFSIDLLRTQITFKTSFRNCVYDAFKRRHWKETEAELEWDIYWAERYWIRGEFDNIYLDHTQKVNHFRNHYQLTRKDLMLKNLKKHKKNIIKE